MGTIFSLKKKILHERKKINEILYFIRRGLFLNDKKNGRKTKFDGLIV